MLGHILIKNMLIKALFLNDNLLIVLYKIAILIFSQSARTFVYFFYTIYNSFILSIIKNKPKQCYR